MPKKNADTNPPQWAHQVELAVGWLDSLSTLPCVAVRFFPKLWQDRFSPAGLADIIETDPALTAKILSLSGKQGISLPDGRFSLAAILDKLPADEVRDALLSIKILTNFKTGDPEGQTITRRAELLLHSLAVACCAREIAEITLPQVEPNIAYCAGLLHDLGKLALEEVMPKSFARIVEQARSAQQCSCAIERQHLGADHTIFGKRLAQKWHLPDRIVLAIWLHHSDTATISWHIPQGRLAQLIQSADSIARQSGIGQSGSFDSPEPAAKIAQSLGINLEQLQQICQKLPETVAEKSRILGLDLLHPGRTTAQYCDIVHTATAQFARKQAELSAENRQLQSASSHLSFVTDFLLSIDSSTSAIDIAENFATRWQRFYQTGMVCLYLVPPDPPPAEQSLEAVIVESLGQSKKVLLNVPEDSAPIPKAIANKFAILDARQLLDWLFEQLDVDFDRRQTKLAPLLSAGKAVGVIVFELHWPTDTKLFEEKFRTTASIAGTILDVALAGFKQEYFAERFAQLISRPRDTQPHIVADTSLNVLAEMAAGIAHELNNPLSVISGRAQLLAEAETDPKKKQPLKQIHENASEASAIVEELMSFAEPPQPREAQTDIKQMLDEAIQLASQKAGVENINVQVQVAEDVKNVFVDSGQIVSAMANVICNSLESYKDKMGPIKITADAEADELVRLKISDQGCGMDAETVRKATQPFFSAKPAGRKRGMGLAYAARLIRLNKGTLEITSQPGRGTTVTISLPCK
ncbi:MAG: HDOD domain-containing protein [Sedimentisphaerales bacterium]